MLDVWIEGQANRVSPEGPVLVLKEHNKRYSIGGAGNVAVNIANLKVPCELYGAVGQDEAGKKLIKLFLNKDIHPKLNYNHSITTTKTRIIGQGGKHVLRLDKEENYSNEITIDCNENDIAIVSDYNKGVIKKDTISKLLEKTKYVIVDPKQSADTYDGAYIVKPNMKEYKEWNGVFSISDALKFMREHQWTWLIVTDGSNGAHVLCTTGEYQLLKEKAKDVADVTGAGDTFLSVLAYGISKDINIFECCKLACMASARNVEQRGVVPVTLNDLQKGVIFTNGVFDILHIGHLELLKYAKSLGKKLIVGINSDDSVKKIKGPDRPINDVDKRKKQLEMLPWVDEVKVFEEDNPYKLMKEVMPDIIVKGGDWTVETTIGNELAEVKIFSRIEGHSTSDIIEKIKNER